MRIRSVASEAFLGLRRNLVMSLAAVLTVAVSLAFVGTALLVRKTAREIQDIFYTQIEISIFLKDGVTEPQRTEVTDVLGGLPIVENVIYESKAEAFRRSQKQFADQPDLLANITEDALPESYRVKLRDPTQYDVVASAVRDLPAVDQVVDYRKFLQPLFTTLNGLRTAAVYIAGVQLLAATLLIANTVRVTAFSRRRETGVMRLVGATRHVHPAAVPARGHPRRRARRGARRRADAARQGAAARPRAAPAVLRGDHPVDQRGRHPVAGAGPARHRRGDQRPGLAAHPAALPAGLIGPTT